MATLVEIKVFHWTHLAGIFDFSLTSCPCWQRSISKLPFESTKSKYAGGDWFRVARVEQERIGLNKGVKTKNRVNKKVSKVCRAEIR